MSYFSDWWTSVPSWAKPVILTVALSLAVASVRWIFPFMLKRFYIWVLDAQKSAEAEIRSERLADGIVNVRVLPAEIQNRIRFPRWIVRRAERWRNRFKEYGV